MKRTWRIVRRGVGADVYWTGSRWTFDENDARLWMTEHGAENALVSIPEDKTGMRREVEVSA